MAYTNLTKATVTELEQVLTERNASSLLAKELKLLIKQHPEQAQENIIKSLARLGTALGSLQLHGISLEQAVDILITSHNANKQ